MLTKWNQCGQQQPNFRKFWLVLPCCCLLAVSKKARERSSTAALCDIKSSIRVFNIPWFKDGHQGSKIHRDTAFLAQSFFSLPAFVFPIFCHF
jgi:hypothetical protein